MWLSILGSHRSCTTHTSHAHVTDSLHVAVRLDLACPASHQKHMWSGGAKARANGAGWKDVSPSHCQSCMPERSSVSTLAWHPLLHPPHVGCHQGSRAPGCYEENPRCGGQIDMCTRTQTPRHFCIRTFRPASPGTKKPPLHSL